MLTATAEIRTDVPERYAKQLVSHLSRKAVVEPLPDVVGAHRLVFSRGSGEVRPQAGRLVLVAIAADPAALAHVQDVLGRHLVRFGARRELAVSWRVDEKGDEEGAGGGRAEGR